MVRTHFDEHGGMEDPMQGKLTDIHTHLEQFTPEERELALRRAIEAGVQWIVTSGMDLQSSESAVEIATLSEHIRASVGIHPWVAAEAALGKAAYNPAQFFSQEMLMLVRKDATLAIGEVGLDFVDNVLTGTTFHDNPDLRLAQEKVFHKWVELACGEKLPLIIHARGAYDSVISILREEGAHRVGGVIHNFDGDGKTAAQLLDMGFFLSFGGAVTYREAHTLHERVRQIPLDGILIETDAPYMSLNGQATEKNEPANVSRVAETVAGLKNLHVDELTSATYINFKTLLNIRE